MTITRSAEKNVEEVLLKIRTTRRKPGDITYPVKHSKAVSNLYVARVLICPGTVSPWSLGQRYLGQHVLQ